MISRQLERLRVASGEQRVAAFLGLADGSVCIRLQLRLDRQPGAAQSSLAGRQASDRFALGSGKAQALGSSTPRIILRADPPGIPASACALRTEKHAPSIAGHT